ncbi:MAG: Rieske 2Fe-2S domain-containing protein [Myxococcota bacterium]
MFASLKRRASNRVRSALLELGRPPRPAPTAANEESREGEYPRPYPDGWYVVARSTELTDKPLRIEALGHAFVLFRDSRGRAVALDAACPHQGADLSLGKVRGDCIECPFHHWKLASDGSVTEIPYSDRIPPTLRTQHWEIDERYGLIALYWSTDAQRRSAPYLPPRFDNIDTEAMTHRGDYDAGVVRMHLVEFAENSVDFQHFQPLHGQMLIPWTGVKVPGVQVRHQATWELDPDHSHIAWFKNQAILEAFGRTLEGTNASAAICIAGPGGIVSFHFDIPRLGKIILFQTHTPEAPLEQRTRFRWYAERSVPTPLVEYVVGSWITQWREDITIWETKRYKQRPMLVKGDGPVHVMRRWYSRFYPPSPETPSPIQVKKKQSR